MVFITWASHWCIARIHLVYSRVCMAVSIEQRICSITSWFSTIAAYERTLMRVREIDGNKHSEWLASPITYRQLFVDRIADGARSA